MPDHSQPAQGALLLAAMQPAGNVANATMETFNQNTSCAETCHKKATTARVNSSDTSDFLTDFSFVFGLAKPSAHSGSQTSK